MLLEPKAKENIAKHLKYKNIINYIHKIDNETKTVFNFHKYLSEICYTMNSVW